eukprot:jgi/Botrbrau1/4360/Bobra.105_2s0008.1
MQPVSLKDDSIIGTNGQPVQLIGVNWFGFNNKQTMLDGLWAGDSDMMRDLGIATRRIKALGFNTVRLPFSFMDLFEHNLTPRDPRELYTVGKRATEDELRQSVVPDGAAVPPDPLPPLKWPTPASSDTTYCNGWLPSDSVYARFLAIIDFFARNDFYVVIDDHLNNDQATSDLTVVEDPDRWVQYWVRLAEDIAQNDAAKPWVLFDLLNEPDCQQIGWERHPKGFPGMSELYIRVMDAIHQVHPEAVFLVEGCGQQSQKLAVCWGDGFFADDHGCRMKGGQSARSFFCQLLRKPYRGQVILSPHIYPPSVTYNHANNLGKALWGRLTTSFGYLTKEGFSEGGLTQRFPVLYGETGFRIDEEAKYDGNWSQNSREDAQFMADFAAWMNLSGDANDGRHNPTRNLTWWCWNEVSPDTGNLYCTEGPDIGKIWWRKIEWMVEAAGLRPWYKHPEDYTSDGSLCHPVPETSVPSHDVPPHAPDVPQVSSQVPPHVKQPPLGGAETAPPHNPCQGPPPAAPENAGNAAGVQVRADIQEPWSLGTGFGTVVNLVVSPGLERADVPYTVVVEGPYTEMEKFWCCNATFCDGKVTAHVSEDWEALVPSGSQVTLGFVVHGPAGDFRPTRVSINGTDVPLL